MAFRSPALLRAAGACLLAIVPALGTAAPATALVARGPDAPRITGKVDSTQRVTLQGTRSLKALNATDQGVVAPARTLQNLNLVLARSPERQARFDAYVTQLSTPGSGYYHHWLTAAQIGELFGPSKDDIAKVTSWLTSQGLHVDRVMPTGTIVRFSGSAQNIDRAFHAQLHAFAKDGRQHFANTGDQQIPAALAPVVKGISSMDDFFPVPQHTGVATIRRDKGSNRWKTVSPAPGFTVPPGSLVGTTYDVVPADFNRIYNVEPLWARPTPIRGAGQTVAVLERSDVQPADVKTWRDAFLPADARGIVSYVHPSVDSGDTSCASPGRNGDEGEAALDAEWIGAAAPDANVMVASCNDVNTPTFGAYTSALNLLNGTAPPPAVMSLSYGECEVLGLTDVTNEAGDIWETAAAEGTTVYVSTGDAGAAGCDQNEPAAFLGHAVNTIASTPYNVAVGGTDFDDFNHYSAYWTASNLPLGLSAVGYIPEQTWNNSCASSKLYPLLGQSDAVTTCNLLQYQQYLNTAAGSGGPSTLWTQPMWQTDIYGADERYSRMLPDVSLFAASGLYGHALVFCNSDADNGGTPCDYSNPDDVLFNSAGGTSFAAPAMAGVQALLNQAAGALHGNVTPAFYDIAGREYGTNTSPNKKMLAACNSSTGLSISPDCVFRNVTVGNISVPCYSGTSDCYTGGGNFHYGVLSENEKALEPAYTAHAGYNYATGLGSIDATNLVDAVTRYDQPFLHGYAAPADYLSAYGQTYAGDGYSDLAFLNSKKGTFTDVTMKGSTVINTDASAVTAGMDIGAVGYLVDRSNHYHGVDIGSLAWTDADNQLTLWFSDGGGGLTNYLPHAVGDPQASSWKLMGAANMDGGNQDSLLWFDAGTARFHWWKIDLFEIQVLHQTKMIFSVTASADVEGVAGYVPSLADLNGDGFADLVWTSPKKPGVYLWINDQKGRFVKFQAADHAANLTLFGAGDINGDGKTDLVWVNSKTHEVSWWLMNGFSVAAKKSRTFNADWTLGALADYDGDGLADLVFTTGAGDVYEWQGNGNGFQAFRVADPLGHPLVMAAGSHVVANRLQGGTVTAGLPLAGQ